MVSFAGSAPARSSTDRSFACCTVKRPEICPDPPVIGDRIRGAEITWLSSTIASSRPTFSEVVWPKRWAPRMLNLKLTTGSPVRLSKPGWASVRSPPSTMTRRSIACVWPGVSFDGSRSTSVAPGSATMRNSSFAVWPRISFSRCGSWRPGTCTRMRSAPWRWMFGSVVPSASTRRRRTSIA